MQLLELKLKIGTSNPSLPPTVHKTNNPINGIGCYLLGVPSRRSKQQQMAWRWRCVARKETSDYRKRWSGNRGWTAEEVQVTEKVYNATTISSSSSLMPPYKRNLRTTCERKQTDMVTAYRRVAGVCLFAWVHLFLFQFRVLLLISFTFMSSLVLIISSSLVNFSVLIFFVLISGEKN